ncbi:LuxR C-terminal-related transcriptional regulator [Saccharothrix sp. NPDC042600]|uniref:ATP-binding protein n=1 Tax=Saccharothrix TaxID=2071 RepID=UPI003400B00D|nr:LuxR family transcriptional regulator [Saccharothrix mutabilis subsp. capreolus]
MTTGRTRTGLPAPVTELVGRDALVADTTGHVLGPDRVVTLAGPGGVGKTVLALEVARQCRARHAFPVAVARLGDVTRAEELHREVVHAVGITDQSDADPVDVLLDHLRDRELLLVLDNCEHLAEAAGDLCAVLLEEAPGVRVLATSRHHLGIAGERTVVVPPLSLAGGPGSDAMRLLLRRAEAAGRATRSASADEAALAELVEWSSGLPLVLELIAVRLGGGMAPRDVLDRLDGGRLLATRTRRVRSHHRTLEQTLDWSYALCSPEQQRLLARVSVFAGGFSLAAAEEVCAGEGIGAHEVLDLLADLVAKSLVNAGPDGRYRQLQPIREHGRRRLAALGEQDRVRDAHSAYFRALAARYAATWYSPDEVALLGAAHDEMPNFRAALNHCATTPERAELGLGLLTDLGRLRVQFFHALLGEFRTWLTTLLDLAPVRPSPERVGATVTLGWIALCQGSQDAARAALAHCRELIGPAEVAPVVFLEGAWAMLVEDDPRGITLLGRAVELADSPGDRGQFKLIKALAAGFHGDERTGADATADCLADARAAGATWAASWARWACGLVPLRHGDPARAVEWFRESLETQVALREQWGSTWSSEAIAWAQAAVADRDSSASGVLESTAELLGAAVALQEATGVAIGGLVPFRRRREQARRTVVASVGETRFREAFQRGTGMDREAVYALALRPKVRRVALADLTTRQREIALLVAAGHPNHVIATRLHLSVSTVENHLTALFAKVGVANRVELAAWVAART